MDCATFDAQVVRQDPRIAARSADFVFLRLTRMNGVDLNLFSFDYDLTWMGFFLNARGRIYSRYGGRGSGSADELLSAEGLLHTMDEVLRVHRAEKDQGPQPATAPRPAQTLPPLAAMLKVRPGNCIHCHQVNEALHATAREGRESLFSYPPPENVGLRLDPVRGNDVREVLPGSAAARAGLRPGDRILAAEGHEVFTSFDLRHALNGLGGGRKLALRVERQGKPSAFTLNLPEGWRRWDVGWRRSLKTLQFQRVGLLPVELSWAEKKALGIPASGLGVRLRLLLAGSPARQAGLREGDVIVAVAGERGLSADAFRTWFLLRRRPGDAVPVTFLRGGHEQTTTLVCP